MPCLRLEAVQRLSVGPVDVEVAAGQTLVLSGPSGAGKTLLLRTIADLDPHQGEVWLDGAASGSVPAHCWRGRVGFLAADVRWWYPRVGAHFPAERPDFIDSLGFEPDVFEWPVERLSSGERQRLGLARLLARRPQALLLDEPTANVDPERTLAVEALVRQYADRHRAPVLWVAHTEQQIGRIADRHCRLAGGRLEELACR